ncbi:MAG: cell filamentation protein Fic [Omnitrophica WOR_2 bacterium RIFCSPLOWO2_12_FULL_46_30]|nr:MAG: cell filamentation protein Fic [Omnitrophica WOR_2 bacterium RIFCSPLOWO2_02_FULL_45_28]OGX52102.1 MAG: cell filamentation protein Fic [Omnitrophica WOR_2 bacterium RIFCSPLOWO2_12_FULL_46_30]
MNEILKEIDKLQEEINAYRPLPPNTLKQLKEYYRVGLTYTSNALEGNSLTETETKVVLEDGITIGGKPIKDYYEALGHSEAYDYIYKLAKGKEIVEDDIKKLHKLFYYRIDAARAGKYRKEKVFISGSKYTLPSPGQVPELMSEFIGKVENLEKENHPVEYCALVHKKIAFIHPFIDGNGRVARLSMNLILLQKGYSIAIIPPILRRDYIQALEKAHTDDKDFREFIAGVVRETQKDYLRLLQA